MHDSHQNIQILWKTYIYPLYLPVRLTPLTLPLYTPSLHSFVYYAALHCTGTAQLPLGYPLVTKKTFFLHPFSRSLFYPISICDSPPFDTPSFHSTLLLYAPYPTSSLSSHSTYNSLTHPTLRLPLFTPSLHSFTIHTPLKSSSLPSASTPFSTISTAQSPLGSPLVTRQPPYMTNPPLPLHFYSSTSLHYTPSLPHLYPLSTFTLHMAHPPLTLPLLLFPTSYSLSILPIYPPLYHPTLQPLSTISSPTGYKSTPPYD